MRKLVLDPEKLPLRFTYDWKEYSGIPGNCICETNGNKITYIGEVDTLEVRAECVAYDDFDASEWTVYFTNKGNEPSKRLMFLYPIDTVFKGENARIYTCNGDYNSPDGYSTAETRLSEGAFFRQAPYGGRSCDRAFPYHRIQFDGHGYNIAVGWPGEWEAEFKGIEDGVCYTAGQQQSRGDQDIFSVSVLPGETIRTPLIAVVSYDGDIEYGINVWRRWFIKYVGIEKPMTMASYRPVGTVECSATNEENQISQIKKVREAGIGIDVWWIDAGWYKCRTQNGQVDWWGSVGDWDHDEERFPRGLAPIGIECEKQNMKFLLWFEPERVMPSSRVTLEHPEWILTHDWYEEVKLLDIGQKECCDYLIKKIGDLLEKYHVKIFRQDYNIDEPLRLWRNNDPDGRHGATENLNVQGYLRFWDALLERFPGLIIDSCASGGRRNDIETLRRSVVMHHTDNSYGVHPVQQSFMQTLYSWIPYFRGFSNSFELEDGTYSTDGSGKRKALPLCDDFCILHSFAPMTNGLSRFAGINLSDEDYKKAKEYASLFERVSPYLTTGDFYALTPYHKSAKKWTSWQFDMPLENKGIIEVIRNNAAESNTVTVFPRALDGRYLLENLLTGEQKTYCGGELVFEQPMRSVSFWEYKKLD